MPNSRPSSSFAALAFLILNVQLIIAAKPNILFVVADDMSHTGCYGHEFVKTPYFDSLAERGLRFNRMYTPSSKCAPSRAVIITGRNPWQLEAAANHQPIWPEKFKSVVESLTDHGYFTGFTGKGWNPGIHPKDRNLTGKEYNDLRVQNPPTKNLAPYDYAANFAAFMKDRPSEDPFFFWYGCKEPHRGYEYKSGVKSGKKIADLKFTPTFWGDSERVKHDILDYAVEIEYFDTHLGRILAQLEDSGELENTLIIATSDNSMPFPRFKGHPHEFATRVPFVVYWPGMITNPGRQCDQFASFTDLAPTFLEAAGIPAEKSGMQPIQGKSLFDFFNDNVQGRTHVLTGRERNDICRPHGASYPVRSLHRGDFVYMHNFEPTRWPSGTAESGFRDTDWSPTKVEIVDNMPFTPAFHLCFGKRPQEELYNIKEDPECLTNLASREEFSGLKSSMKTSLFAELKSQGDPRLHSNGALFEKIRPERLRLYDKLLQQESKRTSKK
ncbi:MAG: sulfatase family protein [Verrucomicrobiaceae bacterium]